MQEIKEVTMTDNARGLSVPIGNGTFSGLVLGVSGWVVLHVAAMNLHARVAVHGAIALVGLGVAIVIIRRYRQYLLEGAAQRRSRRAKFNEILDKNHVVALVLLVLIGLLLTKLVLLGSIFLLAVYVGALAFVPWSRMALCRQQVEVSAFLVGLGVLSPFLVSTAIPHPIYLLAAGWLMWLAACIGLVRPDSRQAPRGRGHSQA